MLFIEEDLRQKLKRIKGAFVENKKFSLSVHFRQVSEKKISKVSDIFYSTLDPLIKEEKIKISYGKKVLGVYPALKLNKGRILLWMIKNSYSAAEN